MPELSTTQAILLGLSPFVVIGFVGFLREMFETNIHWAVTVMMMFIVAAAVVMS